MTRKLFYIVLSVMAIAAVWYYRRRATQRIAAGLPSDGAPVDGILDEKTQSVLHVSTGGKDTVATVLQVINQPEIAVDLFGNDQGELELKKPLKDTTFTVSTTASYIGSIAAAEADGSRVNIERLSDVYKTPGGLAAVDFRVNTDKAIESIHIITR
ncbi:MAG: hypothetical protein LBD91_08515 [Prevotellaceae bacterium]|jgi:hypothetical protein|nr:hypothetical protein [Prevotellaceae bacterium]